MNNDKLSIKTGNWLVIAGIILGIIGFFWEPILLGVVAVVLGVIGLFSPDKRLNWASVIVGIIAVIIGVI